MSEDTIVYMSEMRTAEVRTFDSGATRSPIADKLEYARFFDSRVLKRRAEYMHKHRKQSDGQIREPDNWKRGIPLGSYHDSLTRHIKDIDLHMQGYDSEAEEDFETAVVAAMFNLEGMLFEILKFRDIGEEI
jgi:hypothetical protein